MSQPGASEHQQTLSTPVGLNGRGLFTGEAVSVTLQPAEAGTGIVFRRLDLPGSPTIPAHIEFAVERRRRTSLDRSGVSVELVEHCLSALAGVGIDNARIELSGPELPAGDGSASAFVEAVMSAGISPQSAPRRPIVITEPVILHEGDAMVSALPLESGRPEYVYLLDYGSGSSLGRQAYAHTLMPEAYLRDIAPARTFSTQVEAEALRAAGLFKHLTPRDMLVIGEGGPIDNSFRFIDEPARHKVLDLIGDLSLVGRPIRGRIVAVRSGHALNQKLAREIHARFGNEERSVPADPSRSALDIRAILSLLPHRFPMVLVDRVTELVDGIRAVGIKNVTYNEPFFQGHYPSAPIMPGVLIVEAMSQLAGLLMHRTLAHQGKIAVLLSIDGVRLRKPVTPGDQLVLEATTVKASARAGEAACRALVSGRVVAEAQIKFLLVDPGRTD